MMITATTMRRDALLRPLWQRVFGQAWVLNLVLFVLLSGLRAYGILGPERASVRQLILVSFLAMWFLPFVFLHRDGRRATGLGKPGRLAWLAWGPLLGAVASMLLFGIGMLLYGRGADHWYVAISQQYLLDDVMSQLPLVTAFVMFTVPAMLLSPIGEEFFFRGMVHESVRTGWGERTATLVNGLAFAGVHFLHYGVARDSSGWHVRAVPGLLWFVLMMGVSWLFTMCRKKSGSIWPAVLAHSTFNLVMNLTIFLTLI
jgi:membrane protease YdiL (CAAX protease family)